LHSKVFFFTKNKNKIWKALKVDEPKEKDAKTFLSINLDGKE
jgi:hypothetical protein